MLLFGKPFIKSSFITIGLALKRGYYWWMARPRVADG